MKSSKNKKNQRRKRALERLMNAERPINLSDQLRVELEMKKLNKRIVADELWRDSITG